MAGRHPVRLDDFCRVYDLSLFNVSLPCIFCNFICDLQDLASFFMKQLSIVWRNGKPFVCCRKCALLSAKHEFERFCVCLTKAASLENLLQKPLRAIVIRCVYCYQLLDISEKLDCCASDESFALVRGTWRGPCRHCIRKQ